MSRVFYAEDRITGVRWAPKKSSKQYLVIYDSGFLAVVTEDFYTHIEPLDQTKWKIVNKTKDQHEHQTHKT